MRKSPEVALDPKPLSGIARYSPGLRPSMTEEKPWTGCEASGNVMPLTTPGGSRVPAGGPGASVAAGRTALPARVTLEGSVEPADAGATAVSSPAATAEVIVAIVRILCPFMVVLPVMVAVVCRGQTVDLPVSRPRRASVPIHARDSFVRAGPCARDARRGGCCPCGPHRHVCV